MLLEIEKSSRDQEHAGSSPIYHKNVGLLHFLSVIAPTVYQPQFFFKSTNDVVSHSEKLSVTAFFGG
jgi:hypothetical protein